MTPNLKNNPSRKFRFSNEGKYQIKDKNVINFAISIIVLVSIIFIFISQISFQMSPAFKLFMNEIWYPILMIALPFSATNIGFKMWTDKNLTFKEMWQLMMRRSFFSYYFYAIIIATIGLISIAIVKSTGNLQNINSGWYATYFFASFTPLQNFSGTGTIFTISMFWFTLMFPFILRFFNKLNHFSAFIFVSFLALWCMFLGIWNDLFQSLPHWSNSFKNWHQVTQYSQFIVIFSFLFAGMYIKKYIENIDIKISSSLWMFIVLSSIVTETCLNVHFDKYQFIIAKNVGGPIGYLCTIFSFLTLTNVKISEKLNDKKWFKKVDKANLFMTLIVGDIFTTIMVFNHYFEGYIVCHFILNLDVQTITKYYLLYPQARIFIEGYDPNLGWILIGFSISTCWISISLGVLRIYCYKNIDKWINYLKTLLRSKKRLV